jgi:predicted Zn-dependent peptidase
MDEVVDISLAEMRRVVHEPIPAAELELVRDQAVSSILLGLESSSARASTLARQEIIHHRRISPEEVIRRLDEITPDDLQQVARKYFTSEGMALGALGNLNGFRVDRSRLEI